MKKTILLLVALIMAFGLMTPASALDTAKAPFSGLTATIGVARNATNAEISKQILAGVNTSVAVDVGYTTSLSQFNQSNSGPEYYGELGGYLNIATKAKFMKLKIGAGPGVYRTFDGIDGPDNNIGAFGMIKVDIGNVYIQYKYTTIQDRANDSIISAGVVLFSS